MSDHIECLRCGNCCPRKTCEYFSMSDGLAACIIYNNGTYTTPDGQVYPRCKAPPKSWYCNGFLCEAVMRALGTWPLRQEDIFETSSGQKIRVDALDIAPTKLYYI